MSPDFLPRDHPLVLGATRMLARGESATIAVAAPPGEYVVVCTNPDSADLRGRLSAR